MKNDKINFKVLLSHISILFMCIGDQHIIFNIITKSIFDSWQRLRKKNILKHIPFKCAKTSLINFIKLNLIERFYQHCFLETEQKIFQTKWIGKN